MKTPVTDVNHYLRSGCGRCRFYNTPHCKVNNWREVLVALRNILLSTSLKEEIKWSMPCYTYQGRNVVMLCAFKDYAALSFFNGALLNDPKGLLHKPGDYSQAARYMRFTQPGEVKKQQAAIYSFIKEAIELQQKGVKVVFKKELPPLPDELIQKMKEHAGLKQAFEKLTPGRQRGYLIYFTQPKQASTRLARIEKCIPDILAGKGLYD